MIFPSAEQAVEVLLSFDLVLPDAAELGSVTGTDGMPREAALACRMPPPYASH